MSITGYIPLAGLLYYASYLCCFPDNQHPEPSNESDSVIQVDADGGLTSLGNRNRLVMRVINSRFGSRLRATLIPY